MITANQISVYRKYGGDIDGLVRVGMPEDRSAITEEEWFLIDSLVQKLSLVKLGKASAQYAQEIYEEIRKNTESGAVSDELNRLA